MIWFLFLLINFNFCKEKTNVKDSHLVHRNQEDLDHIKLEKVFYLTGQTLGLESLETHIDKIDIIAPQSYKIDSFLVVKGKVSKEVLRIASKNKKKLMPLIMNEHFSPKIIHQLLISKEAQEKIIQFMINEAKINHFIGWQFDIEHILYTDRDLYSEFVERTYNKFKENHLILSAAVIVSTKNTKNDFYKNWWGAFDYKRLSNSLDFITIMTYDDPNSKGPVASMPYIDSAYNHIKSKIPSHKISLGIPLYYWHWKTNNSKRISIGGKHTFITKIKKKYPYKEGYSTLLKCPYLLYKKENEWFIIWYEDEKSIQEKVNFAKKNHMRGISAWVLGVENDDVWKAF